jgi:hypothetical protein
MHLNIFGTVSVKESVAQFSQRSKSAAGIILNIYLFSEEE